MQFKHPEFLYALFLLLIPIIVHLFQLRRFQKEYFTNVEFLKKVQLQTRKSSQLKKWLTLLARLMAIAAVVIAFAQPFIPHSQEALQPTERIIYIDNSFSLQQKGEQGELLKQGIQQILKNLPDDQQVTVLTNDEVYHHENLNALKNELLDIDYSSTDDSFKTIALRVQNLIDQKKTTQKQFIAISDFQEKNLKELPNFPKEVEVQLIPLRGNQQVNFSIDSVYISADSHDNSELEVQVSASKENEESIPVSLYRKDKLIAKSSVGFDHDARATTTFSLNEIGDDFEGRVVIEDRSLKFDNTAYFSLQKAEKVKVVVINGDKKKGAFLKRIYSRPEFDWREENYRELDFNTLTDAHFIVLNELEVIPNGLENILSKHLEKGGSISMIPARKIDINSYNKLLNQLHAPLYSDYSIDELKITSINFGHPLYSNVFDGEVENFQYPKVEAKLNTSLAGSSSILSFNDGTPFLWESNRVYMFASPINIEESNFTRSPLVAPTFYNMAIQSLKLPQLSYTIGKFNEVVVPVDLKKDEVVHLENESDNFIPQQRRLSNRVELKLQDLPEKAGTYQLMLKNQKIGQLSFNNDRSENELVFSDLSEFPEAHIHKNIKEFFTAEINKNQVDYLWKWFVIFALIFLIAEVLLLKLLK